MRIDGVEQPVPPRPRIALAVLIAITVLVFVGFIALQAWAGDVQTDPPRVIGRLWGATSQSQSRIFYVREERREKRGYLDSDGLISYTLPYSIYSLQARDAQSGELLAVEKIARINHREIRGYSVVQKEIKTPPEILGVVGETLWLWNSGLTARDIRTLALTLDPDRIKAANPQTAATLMDDPKQYRLIAPLDALVTRGSDANHYRIDPASAQITRVDPDTLAAISPEHHKTAESAFGSLTPPGYGLRGTSESSFLWTSHLDPETGVWFGLLSRDEEPPSHWKHPRYGFGPTGKVARRLFRANFTREPSAIQREGVFTLAPTSATRLGEQEFLLGGFLRHPGGHELWTRGEGDGRCFYILHRESLHEDAPWRLSRTGTDGSLDWTTPTGLAEIEQLVDAGSYIGFFGYADRSQPLGQRPGLLVLLDPESGQARVNPVDGAGSPND